MSVVGVPLRILMVSDYGFQAGGAEILLYSLSKSLRERGHEVRILASRAGRKPTGNNTEFADYWCLGTESRLRGVLQAANPWAAHRLRRIIDEFRPDLVHIHMFLTQLSPAILGSLQEVPSVHTAHWYRTICMTGFKMLPDGTSCRHVAGRACLLSGCVPLRDWIPLRWQLRTLQKRSAAISRVIAASETIRNRLQADGFRVDETIPYGIEEIEPRMPLEDPPRVGFAARLVSEKGGEVLLEAFRGVARDVPNACLDVYGDGPELPELKRQAQRFGIHDRTAFHGYLEQAELQRSLGAAWVQVVPTLVEEPGGMVAYEAAMRGTAVVASDHGGLQDSVVHGATGYLVPPGDAEAMATRITELLRNKHEAERLGQAGRRIATEKYSLRRMVDRYERIYRELSGEPSR